MSVPVIGLGAGGHAKVVVEILQTDRQYELVGLLDSKQTLHGTRVLGVTVLGGDEELSLLKGQGVEHFFVGVGSTSDSKPRERLYKAAVSLGMKPVTLVHPSAIVSHSALLKAGVTVMAAAVVNASACLGDNVIVNTGAIIEHDCTIGDHVHVASGARLGSNVRVGAGAHIGIGAVIRQLIQVGSGAVVGAGAVVVKDVPDGQTVIGNPARPLRGG